MPTLISLVEHDINDGTAKLTLATTKTLVTVKMTMGEVRELRDRLNVLLAKPDDGPRTPNGEPRPPFLD